MSGMQLNEIMNCSLKEIGFYLEAYYKQKEIEAKERVRSNYELAKLTAAFVGMSMGGKEIPSIEKLYPSINRTGNKKVDNKMEEQKTMLYMDQFRAFAESHNKQRMGV